MRAFKSLKPRLCHEILTIELQMILLESASPILSRGGAGLGWLAGLAGWASLYFTPQSAQIGGKSAIVPELSPDTDQEQSWWETGTVNWTPRMRLETRWSHWSRTGKSAEILRQTPSWMFRPIVTNVTFFYWPYPEGQAISLQLRHCEYFFKHPQKAFFSIDEFLAFCSPAPDFKLWLWMIAYNVSMHICIGYWTTSEYKNQPLYFYPKY